VSEQDAVDIHSGAKILFQQDGETVALSMTDFRKIIRDTVNDALEHQCRIPLEPAEVREVPHIIGMVKDIGDGKLDIGVERIRQNHHWFCKTRKLGEKVGTGLILLILGAVVTGVGSALWVGIKHLIHGVKG
jgi:hypothetical protein